MAELIIYQLNLWKSLIPTQELLLNADLSKKDNKIKILSVQEPNSNSHSVMGFGSGLSIFASSKDNKRIRAAIVSNHESILKVVQHSSPDCVVTCVNFHGVNIYVCSVYIDPYCDFGQVLNDLDLIANELSNELLLITGDINAKHQAWGELNEDERGRRFYDFCCSHRLYILNDGVKPTYVRNNSQSRIDISICSGSLLPYVAHWSVSDAELHSDHKLIITKISSTRLACITPSRIYLTRKYKTSNVKWDHFKLAAKYRFLTIGASINNSKSERDITTALEDMTNNIIKISDAHLPKLHNRPIKNYWWTPELTILRKRLLASKRRYNRTQCQPLRQLYESTYIEIKEKYKRSIIEAKNNSWKKFCTSQCSKNPWNIVYKFCKKGTNLNNTLNTIDTGNGFTKSPSETASVLIDTFFPEDSPDNADQSLIRQDSLIAPDTQNEVPFSKEEVDHIIGKLNDKKAPGWDSISANIIKAVHECNPNLFRDAFNKCLELGVFPQSWKISVVKVIPKPNTVNHTPNSLRPISLVPVLGKILEKLMIDRIMFHLRHSHSLHKGQYGFMPNSSTEDAVNEVTSWMEQVYSNKSMGLLISLDITGAFNNAWWPKILQQLKEKNCPKNAYKLAQSYFYDREVQLTVSNSTVSRKMSKGCPQGSTCSPGFWVVLYDDILNLALPKGCKLITFADDALLLVRNIEGTGSSLSRTANSALDKLFKWGYDNKLNFNPSKTTAMVVTKKRKYEEPKLLINNQDIEIVKAIKYLGVIIDSKLTFREHFNHLASKAKKLLAGLSLTTRPTWGLNSEILHIIYRGAVEPMILYCASSWEKCLKLKWSQQKLLQIQRGFVLCITRAYRTISTHGALVLAGIEPLFLTAQYRSTLYHLRKQPQVDGIDIERRANPLHIGHPAVHCNNVIFTDCSDEHSHQIFTDGSRTLDKAEPQVGCAFVVYQNNTEIFNSQLTLASHCSVYQAELLAILKAIEWCNIHNSRARIFSDSQAALLSIKDKYNLHNIAVNIRSQLCKSEHICLTWIRGHSGTEGNERADELAKRAAQSTAAPSYNLCPISHLKMKLREEGIHRWNNIWKATTCGRTIKELFFPNVPDRLKSSLMKPNFILTQFLSGHGQFGEYFQRFHIKTDNNIYECICGERLQNVKHLMFTCPVFQTKRLDLELHLDKCSVNFQIPLNGGIFTRKCCYLSFTAFLEYVFKRL